MLDFFSNATINASEGSLGTGFVNVDATSRAGTVELTSTGCTEQVRRIIHSTAFRNAATLQSLLHFITSKTISGEAGSLKEYTIGVEALGRRADFDPRVDPIVRVQSHRLRVKLKEYYETEGLADPITIRFPKGHYVPTFESASPELLKVLDSTLDTVPADHAESISAANAPGKIRNRSLTKFWISALAVFAVSMLALGFWLGSSHAEKRLGLASSSVSYDPEVISFWTRLLENDTAPVIAYPDAVFLLDDSNDLFRFRHGAIDSRGALVDPHVAREFAANPELVSQAGPLFYENGYTGTGELESVAMLAGLLGRMGMKPTIKSSRDVLPEDLSQHNVILLGSPFQNPAVAQLLTAGDFSFHNPDQHHEQWRAQILNSHPRDGEASEYGTERDPVSKVLTSDYGLITVTRTGASGKWIAILGGLDTKGTEGAANFITSKAGVDRLHTALQLGGNKEMSPFQALVKVDLGKGYLMMSSEMTAFHPIPATRPVAVREAPPAH